MERNDAQGEASGVATLIDARSGAGERVEFLDAPTGAIMSHLHVPPAEPAGAVLICSSICSDFMANYRQEVLTARALAARGFAAQRFHYRGTGNSGGEPEDVDVETMRADARQALAHVRAVTGSDKPVAVLGTRFGALVAAAVVADLPGAALALWEPTTRPKQYFREGLRAGMMHRLKEDGLHEGGARSAPQTTEQLLATLREQGWVDVLGYAVHQRLYDSAVSLSLDAELGDQPRPLLLAQLAHEQAMKPDYTKLAGELSDRGYAVETAAFRTTGSWWFPGERLRTPDELRTYTVDWVAGRLRGMAP